MTESPSGVSVLIISVVADLIGQSKPSYKLHSHAHERFYISRMNGWIAIWPMFVAEYFPRFGGGLEVTFPVKCKGILACLVSRRL